MAEVTLRSEAMTEWSREQIEAYYAPQLEQARTRGFEKGAKMYGALQFLERGGATVEEVKAEIADAMNWLELLYFKLCTIEDSARARPLYDWAKEGGL
jgi:hypothetical protein